MLEYNLIQTAPAPVQHPLPRRQVLPVPGADGGGDVAARAGHAGREAQERPLLRSLRPRLGHPRHARRAHPRLPGPHLLERLLRLSGPGPGGRASTTTSAAVPGPAFPRPRASPRSPTARTSTRWRTSWRATRSPSSPRLDREMREAAERQEYEQAAKLRDQLAAARRAMETPGDGARRSPRTSTWSAWPRTTWRRRSRCSSSAGAG